MPKIDYTDFFRSRYGEKSSKKELNQNVYSHGEFCISECMVDVANFHPLPDADLLYKITVKTSKGMLDADNFAYDSFELCKRVLLERAMGDEDRIMQILREFNKDEIEQKERIVDDIYNKYEDMGDFS